MENIGSLKCQEVEKVLYDDDLVKYRYILHNSSFNLEAENMDGKPDLCYSYKVSITDAPPPGGDTDLGLECLKQTFDGVTFTYYLEDVYGGDVKRTVTIRTTKNQYLYIGSFYIIELE